ncbi:hypothetical protein WJX77_004160 [Trebouxia sp. C0004]
MLQDDYYRVASKGPPERADFFECITRWNAHNKIDHLTAHQLAFVDVKVRSLLNGEPSIPKTATEQEVIIEHYEQMVSMLQDPNFRSKYATIVDSEPHTPT